MMRMRGRKENLNYRQKDSNAKRQLKAAADSQPSRFEFDATRILKIGLQISKIDTSQKDDFGRDHTLPYSCHNEKIVSAWSIIFSTIYDVYSL